MIQIAMNVKISFVGIVCVVALAACSTPGSLPKDATLDQARASLGAPTAVWPLPAGGQRLQYSGQPSAQFCWNVDFNAKGQMINREQALTDTAFSRIATGRTTRDDVLRDFGRPADIQTFPRKQETSFMYRYVTYGGFAAAFFVNFDPAGVVAGTQTGLDPWLLGGSDRE